MRTIRNAIFVLALSGLSLEAFAANQCLALPDRQIGFGNIEDDDIRAWTGIDELVYFSRPEHLSVDLSVDGRPALRQQMIPTQAGSHTVTGRSTLPDQQRRYRVKQSVYLESGFDWGRRKEGGKLGFGLGAGSSPSGGTRDIDGFTARFMWRGNGDGSARITVYAYHADRTQNLPYGDDFPLQGFDVPVGEWFDLELEVINNSRASRADGSVRAWVNNRLALERDGLRWYGETYEGAPRIEYLSYATFYGGNSWDWAPSRTTYIRFANVCWGPSGNEEPNEGPGETGGADDNIDDEDDVDISSEDDIRGELVERQRRIGAYLPTGQGYSDWRLRAAMGYIDQALLSGNWFSANNLLGRAPAVSEIKDAVRKLSSVSNDRRTARALAEHTETLARDLLGLGSNLAERLMTHAEGRARSAGCYANGPVDSRCRAALRDLQRASRSLEILRVGGSIGTESYHMQKAARRAEDALAHLAE